MKIAIAEDEAAQRAHMRSCVERYGADRGLDVSAREFADGAAGAVPEALRAPGLRAGGGLIPCVSADAAQALGQLSAPDLCTIFGNLLDNAVEAVAAVPERELRDVALRVNRRDGFLLIRTENRFEGERDAALMSTKQNAAAHGYGMKNLRDVVARLGGEMTAGAQDRQFIVNILLPAAA